jgi:uncharacterized protein (DUF1697 family)
VSGRKRIALLRGINVGGHNTIPMAGLRELCAGLGWQDVQTYIQSGNLVFNAAAGPQALERDLEGAILERFGLKIAVIVRAASAWAEYMDANPFPAATEREPNFVHMLLSKSPAAPDAAERLQERADAGERVALAGEALWIHYPNGAGRSKLSPALLDRMAGSPVTGRNWKTVLKIAEMVKK